MPDGVIETPEPIVEAAVPVVTDGVVDPVISNDTAIVDTDTPEPNESAYVPVEEAVTIEGIKYGDLEVNVSLDADIVNSLGEAGLDGKAISEELYSSEDFTLTDETKEKLYEAFPKSLVDSYLAGVKASNDLFVNDSKSQAEAAEAAGTAAWESTMEVMGGEDRWDDMSSFALENLSEEDFNDFNEVMKSAPLKVQQVMIKDLFNKFEEAGKPVAPTILDLETGENNGDLSNAGDSLSYSAYQEIVTSGEYSKDPTKYDALRKAGQKKGI